MAPVRSARAFRWSIIVAALTGCFAGTVPGALAQGQNDLDYMTYGQPGYVAPQPVPDGGGGAIAALRRAFAGASRPAYYAPQPAYVPAPIAAPAPVVRPSPVVVPAPEVYAAAPMAAPIRYDAGYRL